MRTRRDPVVEAASQALADVLTARGGRWIAEPQYDDPEPGGASAATRSPLPNNRKNRND